MAREQVARKQEEVQVHVEQRHRREVVPEVIEEMGVISENTKVIGDIVTKGHVGIAGIVEGNVDAKGTVIIKGVVKGDIRCQNLMIEKGKVLSTIICEGSVAINDGAVITGSITCKDISVGGTVNGRIECAGQAGFTYSAVVNADVVTKKLGVEPGAKLNGKLEMR